MNRIKLKNHIKKGDTLYTPYTNPNNLGSILQLSSWSKEQLPEYIWIGMIIKKLGRNKAFKKLSNIIEDLYKNNICIPQFSIIMELEDEKKKRFWDIVSYHINKDIISPLSILISPDIDAIFYNYFFDFSIDIDKSILDILKFIENCNQFHDNLTTDICFVVDWFYIKNKKMMISEKNDMLLEALKNYHKFNHEDEKMKIYRPIIRTTFKGLSSLDYKSKFSKLIWKRLGEISECEPLLILWDDSNNILYYKKITKLIEYIMVTNDDKKMESKFSVIMGITCYIYKMYREIIENKLQNCISGRVLFRSMIESYINLRYIMLQEKERENIYDIFKAYGIGKYKLIMAKIREEKYSIEEKSQIESKYMELLVNEDMDEAFINMSLGFFDKKNIKQKFSLCNEEMLYEIYYEYGTNFVHGFWGAIRESTMLICDNPTHNYHNVPDYYAEQNLKSVNNDCEMLMKKLIESISEYIEIPEFYYVDKN